MYYIIVATCMLVFPLLSIAVEAVVHPGTATLFLTGKWFVFWAVGMRLLMAGLRQIIQPRYTTETILGIKGAESLAVVRELGFANVAIGAMGAVSILVPGWVTAGLLAGGIFYVMTGLNHAFRTHRKRLENVAMVSDILISVVLLGTYCALALVR